MCGMDIDDDLAPDLTESERDERKQRYILALAQTGTFKAAGEVAGISRATSYRWRQADPEFDKACEEMLNGPAADLLEDAARDRAIDGVDEPVFYKGECVGYVKRYSDMLLSKLLSGRRRAVFGNNDSTTIRVGNIEGEALKTELETSARIAALLELARSRKTDDDLGGLA